MSKTNGLTWYDAEQFRHNVLQHRTLAEPYAVRKSLATAKEIPDDASRTIRFVISSSAEDRDKDVVNVAGWNLDNYKKNSVVMWGHDYKSLPIAKCTSILPRGDKLVAEAQFPSADLYPFADTVYRMLKGGYLNATSVGFRPLKFEPNEKRGGLDYHEQELLEFSVVPIPSNQEALVEARAAGIDLAPIKDWAEGILTGWHGDGLWVKKADVEKLRVNLADLVAKPLPNPKDDEEEDAFISRCMGNPTMNEEYPENDQRAAVCHSQWGKRQIMNDLAILKQEGFEVQSVLFPKAHWDSAAVCKTWLRDHDFKAGAADETEDHYRFRQRDPGEFARMRTICLSPRGAAPGEDRCRIKAVGGPLKSAEAMTKPYGDCPKGENCPMQADMASCPDGKDCPMGKAFDKRGLKDNALEVRFGTRSNALDGVRLTAKILSPGEMIISGTNAPLDKRGRVLSSRNEERLRQALASLNDILGELQKPDTDGTVEPARGPAGEEIVLELADTCAEAVLELTDGKPDGYEVDEAELRQALAGVLQAALKDQVRESVGAAIAAARGRVN